MCGICGIKICYFSEISVEEIFCPVEYMGLGILFIKTSEDFDKNNAINLTTKQEKTFANNNNLYIVYPRKS